MQRRQRLSKASRMSIPGCCLRVVHMQADNIVKIENESSRVGDKRGTPEGKPQLSSRPTQRVKLE